mgnify:CR=1 FL=1
MKGIFIIMATISIDEMIKNGKTLTEIQRELRSQVAARDAEKLKRDKEIVKKRSIMLNALEDWLKACMPTLSQTDIEDILTTTVKECVKLERGPESEKPQPQDKNKKESTAAALKLNKDTEGSIDFESLDWLRDFIGLL